MPELVREVPDQKTNQPLGWLVIDSTVKGRSHGGLRISQHVSSELLTVLARRMTLKFGFLGLANGGAKAGIIGDPEGTPEYRRKLLQAFAESIQPLVKARAFLPHADMGTTEQEIRQVFGNVHRQPSRDDSGYFTGIGVSVAAQVAVQKRGRRMDQTTAAIEGFGKVGASVARLLDELGVKVVAVSTSRGGLYRKDGLPIVELSKLANQKGSSFVLEYLESERISNQDMLALPVGLLCPCALSETIHSANCGRVQAEIVCPGANAPATPEAETILMERGVRVLPDFLTNAGGVLGGTMSFAGIPVSRIRQIMPEFLAGRYSTLFEMDHSEVEQYCLDRHEKMKKAAEHGGLKQNLFEAGLTLYRKELIPKFLFSRLAQRYFLSR